MSAGRQYRLLRELGTGTFGTVYQAEMTSAAGFKKQVALKVLHPMWEADKDAARRFRDEARLLGQLRHRHIVQVDGLVKVGGRWAVVMEFVPGCDGNVVLKACRKAGEAFPVPAALEVAGAVASALDAAYNARPDGKEPLRVIHRDIKPSNIRLTEDGDVKVLDFGIARADFQGREAVTHSVRYGSIRYMAPERHHAAPDTPAGDVFALGCVLFEFLTGKPLGNVEAEWAQHHEKVHAKIAKLREGLGETGSAIADLIQAMLSFEPEERPTAGEIAERARSLARAYPGEDLPSFARKFIPQVARFVPDTSMPIERVVSEGGGSSEEIVQSRAVLPPILTESSDEPPSVSQVNRFVLAGAIMGAALLLVLFVVIKAMNGDSGATATLTHAVPPGNVEAEPSSAMPARSDPPADATEAPEPSDGATSAPSDGAAEPAEAVAHEPSEDVAAATHDAAASTSDEGATAGSSHAADSAGDPPRETSGGSHVSTHKGAATVASSEPTGTRLRRGAKFAMVNATALHVECVGATADGTTAALVREPYPGPCTVRATVEGESYEARVELTQEKGLVCALESGVLACR